MNGSGVRLEIEGFADTLGRIEVAALAAVMATVCAATVAGNLLVLVSFAVDKSLRKLNNWFVLSLAVSDTMIGVFSMPLFTLYALNGEWLYGPVLCDMWLAQDYACSCASSLNIVAIALDRYFSVVSPLQYRARKTSRLVGAMIGCVWTVSLLLWPPWIYAWPYIEVTRTVPEDDCYVQFLETSALATFLTSAVSYWVPVAIICFLYFRIWRVTVQRRTFLASMHNASYRQPRESPQKAPTLAKLEPSLREGIEMVSLETDDKGAKLNVVRGSLPKLPTFAKFKPNLGGGIEMTSIGSSEKYAKLDLQDGLTPLINRGIDAKITKLRDAEPPAETSQASDNLILGEKHEGVKFIPEKRSSPIFKSTETNADNAFPASATCALRSNKDEATQTGDLRRPKMQARNGKDKDMASNRDLCRPEKEDERTNSTGPERDTNTESYSGAQSARSTSAKQQDNKAARMLAVILGVFLVTATPYNVVVAIMSLETGDESLISDALWFFVYYLFYVNSALNPVCYALANRHFRRTYWKVLKCGWWRKPRHSQGRLKNAVSPKSSSTSATPVSSVLLKRQTTS